MKKFDAKNIIDKMAAMSTYTKSFLLPLYSDIFFIDHYRAGVSNKHCLLPFFISTIMCIVQHLQFVSVRCLISITSVSKPVFYRMFSKSD